MEMFKKAVFWTDDGKCISTVAVSYADARSRQLIAHLLPPTLNQLMPPCGVALAGVGKGLHAVGAKVAKVLPQLAPRGNQPGVVEEGHGKRPDAALAGFVVGVAVVQQQGVFAADGAAQGREPRHERESIATRRHEQAAGFYTQA